MVSFEYVSVRLSYNVNKYLLLDHYHDYLLPEVTPFQYRSTLQIVRLLQDLFLFLKVADVFLVKVKRFGK